AGGRGGAGRVPPPGLPLPVQQMGLTVKHSPRYRLTPLPSDFHAQAMEPPLSEALQLDTERDLAKDVGLAGGERESFEARVRQEAAATADSLRDGDRPALAQAPAAPASSRAEAGPRR